MAKPRPVGEPNVPDSRPPAGTTAQQARDHSADLGLYGLPADVAAQVDAIFRRYPNDPAAAAQAAVAYIRQTPWYAQTYPGIAQARQMGFIGTDLGSEREYKQTYNAYNAIYQQYQGRHMTFDEAARLFGSGASPTFVAQQFAGAAYTKANAADIQFLAGAYGGGQLAPKAMKAYGLEKVGYDSRLGQVLSKRLDDAMAKFQRVFQGTSASPTLNVGGAGLAAPSYQQRQTPDVSA